MHGTMHVSYPTIGRHIREARHQAGLTQEALAERLKISHLHFGRLERGERPVSLDQLANMAGELNVSLLSLLEGCTVEDSSVRASENNDAKMVGDAVAALAAGCTPRTCALMVTVCGDIAASEKLETKGE